MKIFIVSKSANASTVKRGVEIISEAVTNTNDDGSAVAAAEAEEVEVEISAPKNLVVEPSTNND
ncbi:hypothetical protein LguiA_030346 [Lonicera macranthoides]